MCLHLSGRMEIIMKGIMSIICTNYIDSDIGQLTASRPLASLPFGGRYRLVDFPLSNMKNSGIRTVGIIMPYMYRSLMDHLGGGKEWNQYRKVGGFFYLPGTIYGLKTARSKFLLRDFIANKPFVTRGNGELVVISGSNKIFNIDYSSIARQHEASGADITLVYKKGFIPAESSELFLNINDFGRVTNIGHEPSKNANCFLDAFVINREMLLNYLNWYEALPYLDLMDAITETLSTVKVFACEFHGYAGSINGLKTYMSCNMDLLNEEVRSELFLPERQISTKAQDSAPAKYFPNAKVKNSIISSGCKIDGTVEDCIIFRDVTISKNAVLKNCVIMAHSVISRHVILENVICDKYVKLQPGIKLCGSFDSPITIEKNSSL